METTADTPTAGSRFARGLGWGVVATLAMSALMLVGVASGASPMPKPIPAAIVGKILGSETARPLLLATAVLAHLAYGGFWGGVLASVTRPVTVGKGIGLGVALWLLMQLVVLPFLGWGLFGAALTPTIAGATLVLHLVYGAVLGWGIDRS